MYKINEDTFLICRDCTETFVGIFSECSQVNAWGKPEMIIQRFYLEGGSLSEISHLIQSFSVGKLGYVNIYETWPSELSISRSVGRENARVDYWKVQ